MTSSVGVTVSYSFSNTDGISVRGSNSSSYTMSGSGVSSYIQPFSGGSTPLNLNNIGSPRAIYLSNQNDASGSLSLSLNSGQTQVFTVLGVGEAITLASSTTGIWGSGVSGVPVYCAVLANVS